MDHVQYCVDFHVLSVLHIHRNKAKFMRGGFVLHSYSLSILICSLNFLFLNI